MTTELHAVLAAVLLALGVSVPLPAFAGGMVIAIGCCFGVMAARKAEARRGIVLSLFWGVLIALLAAILHPKATSVWLWGNLPLQMQMGIAGALSQSVIEAAISFGGGLKDWAGKLPAGFGLPGRGDPK